MQAQRQMAEIVHYVAFELYAPAAAIELIDALEEGAASLSQLPNRIPLTEEEPWRSLGVRRMPIKNYLIYFWVDEDAGKVQILAVIYARRDQKLQLSKIEIES